MKLTPVKNVFKSLGTRYVKYGGFASIVTLAAIVAVIFLNLIFQQFSPQFDLTRDKLFSLSEQTVQVLESIKSPVTIYGIWEPGRENTQAREVAELYAARSRLVSFEAVDPDINPGLLRRFDRDGQGVDKRSLVVEGAKGFRIISEADMYEFFYTQQQTRRITGMALERRITGAILYVSTGETPVIYETTGHGEVSLSQRQMRETVERENYDLKELSLFQSPIPEDASLLILNNPLRELSSQEVEKVLAYLEGGGRLLVLMDYRSGATEGVNEILAGYGLRFDYGVTMEPDLNFQVRSPFELIPNMAYHDIVRPLIEKKTPAILGASMGLSVLDLRRRTVNVVPFLASSGSSFLWTDLNNPSQERGPGDLPGPLTLAAAAVDPEYSQDGKQARIVAIGSAILDPSASFFQQVPGNVDLFMNSLTWLENRQETLSVRSRSLLQMDMRMTGLQVLGFGLAFVILIPLTLFILALVTWLRRRHL